MLVTQVSLQRGKRIISTRLKTRNGDVSLAMGMEIEVQGAPGKWTVERLYDTEKVADDDQARGWRSA